MKLVHGKRLDEFAAEASSISDLLRVFQKVCEAVAFAHARGVIHRDLKPENIMVGPFGEVLVMDWGVAKLLGEGDCHSTGARHEAGDQAVEDADLVATLPLGPDASPGDTSGGTVIGTPAYMAPEQALGKTDLLDQRTDVYALGAILYFLLTRCVPFEAAGSAEATRERPPHPRQINQKIPRSLEAVCLKAMSELRENRYAGAEEIARDVVAFLDGQPVSAYPENIFEKTGRWLGKNRFIVLLIVAYLIMRVLVFFLAGG
jgi:serine/threonine protein kinase